MLGLNNVPYGFPAGFLAPSVLSAKASGRGQFKEGVSFELGRCNVSIVTDNCFIPSLDEACFGLALYNLPFNSSFVIDTSVRQLYLSLKGVLPGGGSQYDLITRALRNLAGTTFHFFKHWDASLEGKSFKIIVRFEKTRKYLRIWLSPELYEYMNIFSHRLIYYGEETFKKTVYADKMSDFMSMALSKGLLNKLLPISLKELANLCFNLSESVSDDPGSYFRHEKSEHFSRLVPLLEINKCDESGLYVKDILPDCKPTIMSAQKFVFCPIMNERGSAVLSIGEVKESECLQPHIWKHIFEICKLFWGQMPNYAFAIREMALSKNYDKKGPNRRVDFCCVAPGLPLLMIEISGNEKSYDVTLFQAREYPSLFLSFGAAWPVGETTKLKRFPHENSVNITSGYPPELVKILEKQQKLPIHYISIVGEPNDYLKKGLSALSGVINMTSYHLMEVVQYGEGDESIYTLEEKNIE